MNAVFRSCAGSRATSTSATLPSTARPGRCRSPGPRRIPITQAFAAAAARLGYAFEADKNGAMDPGYGPLPMNVVDGVRWNTAMAYPLDRVSMLTDTLVRRVVFHGTRAVGIETDAGEVIRGRQVVLCAGAIGSAHLLLRSGVGPAAQLRDSGIAVVHDSPGVGASFSDHPQVAVEWYARTT